MNSCDGAQAEEELQYSSSVKDCIQEPSASLFVLDCAKSNESEGAKTRLKYLGSYCGGSGAGIFFNGKNLVRN